MGDKMKKIKKMLSKLKGLISKFYGGLKERIFQPGRGILTVLGIILAVILLIVLVVCMVLGCVGGILYAVLKLFAWILMIAFNAVVPAFGGPEVTLKQSMGILVLVIILAWIVNLFRK